MPAPIEWTPKMDATIIELRGIGYSWDAIASNFGYARHTVSERGRSIGADLPVGSRNGIEAERPPLPAGSDASWGAIIASTCLDGAAFVYAGVRA